MCYVFNKVTFVAGVVRTSKVLLLGSELEYILTISCMAHLDPKTKANRPKITTITFLIILQLNLPKPLSQKVKTSMNTGISRPRMEKQKAPIRDTNGIMVGTAIAKATQITTSTVRTTYSATLLFSS